MVLPPVTPAPSRFILSSKRQSTQPPTRQTQTPDFQKQQQQQQLPSPVGPHQFHATPRFTSTASARTAGHAPGLGTGPTLRFSTHALAAKAKARPLQDIIDDGSPSGSFFESPPPPLPQGGWAVAGGRFLPEPIEVISSSLIQAGTPTPTSSQGEGGGDGGRVAKRRRISITSSEGDGVSRGLRGGLEEGAIEIASSPVGEFSTGYGAEGEGGGEEEGGDVVEGLDSDGDHGIYEEEDSLGLENEGDILDADSDGNEFEVGEGEEEDLPIYSGSSSPRSSSSSSQHSESPSHSSPSRQRRRSQSVPQQPHRQQPIFHSPPRFKPPTRNPHPQDGNADDAADPNPDIFSPQRRGGPHYLPGGLASELRDWLLEIKESDAEQRRSLPAVRLSVDAARDGGPGMMLVAGRPFGGRGRKGPLARAILAGDGLVEGLANGGGNRARVVPGGVVTIAPPAWDVQLGEMWAVAYRWGAERPTPS